MKVNVSSVARIQSSRVYTQIELINATSPVAGKNAVVDVADSVTGSAFVVAAKGALGITPPAGFVKAVLVLKGEEVDEAKTLSALGVKDGSEVQVRYYVQIA
jgi:hypothetical protein